MDCKPVLELLLEDVKMSEREAEKVLHRFQEMRKGIEKLLEKNEPEKKTK